MYDTKSDNSAETAAAKKLIKDISAIKLSKTAQTVCLLPQINIYRDGVAFSMSLSFKIGIDKLYVVKDIYEFLDTIGTNGCIPYGKSFTFDDSRHVFEHYADKVVSMLSVSLRKTGRMPHAKEIPLTGALKTNILRILSGKQTEIFINGIKQPEMQILNDNIPLELHLSKEDECYTISFADVLEVRPVSDDCSVCIWQNDLYVVSLEQAGCISSFLDAYRQCKMSSVSFPAGDKSKVILNIMPKLRAASNLQIDSNVKRDVIVTEFKSKLYIDKTAGEDICVRALFCYDNIEFNHFAGEKPNISGKVLLRDRRSENAFIRAAAACGFKPENGLLYIREDNKIYDFLSEKVATLTKFGDIYYSDDFNIKIVSPKRGSAGVRLTDSNLLEFDLALDDIDTADLSGIFASVREKGRYYRLDNGSFVDLGSEAIQKSLKLLDNLDVPLNVNSDGTFSVPISRVFYLNRADSEEIHIERDEYFNNFIQKFAQTDISDIKVPSELEGIMRPYQVSGFRWLTLLAKYGLGGILADEMGLGKTLQAIAFVMHQYKENPQPTLIVAPTSLIYNWQAEIEKFMPTARVCIVSGTPQERREISKNFSDSHFVITSYGLLRRDIDFYTKYKFAYCFIDEAQHIKNPSTINAKSVKRIKAGGFFALTGTPLENTLTELWSIFDFIMPGYLYSRHKFRKLYEVPIVKERDKAALENLLKHTKPFILRRLKTQVMSELPEKIESYMISEFSPEQKLLYAAYALKAKEEFTTLSENGGFERNRMKILSLITRLRQLCCHPSLFVEDYNGDSGKLEMLKELVESALNEGHRILLFSQFTSMLKIISSALDDIGVTHYYLDGNTKSHERVDMVNRFNAGGSDVFLISLKAGGTGLNLTGADMVIHYDPWWNPAVENQATDRAHRIGQTRTVQVLKLVARGSIEEKICNLQKVKQDMIDSVLETGETLLSSMSLDEIKELFD